MNNEVNMFEVAARKRFRFPFKGSISVEDLWMLSVKDLDAIFKALNSELKSIEEESLLNDKSQKDIELDLKIQIVKHIVKVKLEEEQNRINLKQKKEQKQEILELIALKKKDDLRSKSIEELQSMIEDMDN